VTSLDTFDELIARETTAERFRAQLIAAFGALALIIAGTGLYGTVARSVASRRHEVGVRLALGADGARVGAMILRHGGLIVAVGLSLGTPLAWVAVRTLTSLLPDLAPASAFHYAIPALVLAATASLATAVPALTASRIPPSQALRR
jgi:putative ABC transport system permease protein